VRAELFFAVCTNSVNGRRSHLADLSLAAQEINALRRMGKLAPDVLMDVLGRCQVAAERREVRALLRALRELLD